METDRTSELVQQIQACGGISRLVGVLTAGTPRSIRWASAALCNLSMHGAAVRQAIVEAAGVEALTARIQTDPRCARRQCR